MEKLIITVAPTGAWPRKENTPYVPLTPEEIADDVYKSWKAGAAIAHIHVRDDEGRPCMEYDKFEKTVKLIRERCDIVLNLTTSGGLDVDDYNRMKPFIELKPELASFDAGSMNWMHSGVFLNSPKFLEKLAGEMQANNVKPEIEIFDTGMIYEALYVASKGLIETPMHFQFVLGAPGGMPATVKNLIFLLEQIPKGSTWSVVGIGKEQINMIYAAFALGGHIRVGMEDNVYLYKGELAKSNADFVKRVVRLANEYGREVATPDEARKILNLK